MRCVLGALRVPWREAHLTALRRVDGGRECLCWRLRLALLGYALWIFGGAEYWTWQVPLRGIDSSPGGVCVAWL